MDEGHRKMGRATTLPVILCVAGLLLLLSLLRPVDAYPVAYGTPITPTCFVYLPCVAREPTPTPSPTPTPTPLPGVDLIVWDIVIEPSTPVIGQTIIITVSVKNQGGDDAPVGTLVRLTVDDKPVLPEYVFIAPLQSGGREDVAWGKSSISLGTGPHTAKGEVDPTDLVAETDEDNNTLQDSFEVVSSSGGLTLGSHGGQ